MLRGSKLSSIWPVLCTFGPALCEIALKNGPELCRIALNNLAKSLCVPPALCGIARDQSSAMRHSAGKIVQRYVSIALNNCPAL
jgi:hypothetical protein